MTDLPERFLDSIREMLGEEMDDFLAGFAKPRRYGLRVNTSRISGEEFERISPFSLRKIPWIPNGYFYDESDRPAAHPFYAAGLYYLQEPSAMTPASRLPIEQGERVLDLCAAPGGKATELGARLEGTGQLVANDINQARARALLRNLELFGIRNILVTSEAPYTLAEKFPEYFHKIMVDAPCSGEGMFRKNPAVAQAWMEKGPEYFSRLQKEIIVHGADMLLPGGKMIYSTCTFSPLENEAVITHLLEQRPDMRVIPMEDYEGFSHGLTSYLEERYDPSCDLCRRIWPHRMAGEGHFLALLEKAEGKKSGLSHRGMDDDTPTCLSETVEIAEQGTKATDSKTKKRKSRKGRKSEDTRKKRGQAGADMMTKEQRKDFEDFLSHIREGRPDPDQIEVRGEKVYYVSEKAYEGMGLHFLRNGVYLGDLKKKRFEPSEPFALVFGRNAWDRCLDFVQDDKRLLNYRKGESFPVEDLISEMEEKTGRRPENGWYLVTVEGYALGFGRLQGTILKNRYPSGWRIHSS